MKKNFLLTGIACISILSAFTQVSTNLGQQVAQAAAANRKQMVQYVWNRTVQVFVNGELKNTIVSAISFDTAGKPHAKEISSTPTEEMKHGLRGDIERKKIKELKDYVEGAIKSSMKYIYMTKSQMAQFFSKAAITQPGNVINVQANSLYQAGDQLTLVVNQGSLAFVSQNFNTTYNNTDAVNGSVTYKTFSNGLTTVDAGEIDLPAKNIRLVISNSGFAQLMH